MSLSGTILIATDLSARCDRALERALMLGKQLEVGVNILHVVDSKSRINFEEEEKLRNTLKDEFDLDSKVSEIIFAYGSAPDVIATMANELDCLLLVTGVARYNSPSDYIFGTAIDHLIRRTSVPVLVVKRRARRPYDRLVVATDFSPQSEKALYTSSMLFPTAEILLIHSFQPAFPAFLEHDTTAPWVQEEAETSISRLVAHLPLSLRERVRTVNEEGNVADIISRHIDDRGRDLLVIGSSSRAGHAHFLTSHDGWRLPATEPSDVLVVH